MVDKLLMQYLFGWDLKPHPATIIKYARDIVKHWLVKNSAICISACICFINSSLRDVSDWLRLFPNAIRQSGDRAESAKKSRDDSRLSRLDSPRHGSL
jgi:hypothetical protein